MKIINSYNQWLDNLKVIIIKINDYNCNSLFKLKYYKYIF